jgi:uncharacterized protein
MAGIGLRHPHYRELFERLPALDFVEVHSENFFAAGGAARAVLRQAREHYAVSLHGVGLGLGSAVGIDPWHLDCLAELVAEIEPLRVSDHACFARAPFNGSTIHASDLLPIAFTSASLQLLCNNIAQVQDRLKRPILLENLSAYVAWPDSSMSESEFLRRVCQQSGCQLLLDVNNLYVNALNARSLQPLQDCCAWIDDLLGESLSNSAVQIGEIHLAGFTASDSLVIDDHSARVHADVWQIYAHTVRCLPGGTGSRSSLIEWDTDIPALDVLLDEAAKASTVAALAVV